MELDDDGGGGVVHEAVVPPVASVAGAAPGALSAEPEHDEQFAEVAQPQHQLLTAPVNVGPYAASPPLLDIINRLAESDKEDDVRISLEQLKYAVIGSVRAKHTVLESGIVSMLTHIIVDKKYSSETKIHAVYTLGSLAKGLELHVKQLIDADVVQILASCLGQYDQKLNEACLRCLRTIFQHPDAPFEFVFTEPGFVQQLLKLINLSPVSQSAVVNILMHAIKDPEQKMYLVKHGIVPALHSLLYSEREHVQLAALRCLASLIYGNEAAAKVVAESTFEKYEYEPAYPRLEADEDISESGEDLAEEEDDDDDEEEEEAMEGCKLKLDLIDRIVIFLERNFKEDTQLAAARCITYLHRCKVLTDNDPYVVYKALPCLVRLTHKDETTPENRILAAETLAYLIEVNASLQRIAAISNHLIPSMGAFLQQEALSDADIRNQCSLSVSSATASGNLHMVHLRRKVEQQEVIARSMKQAGFRVFASLGANDEDIRKRIMETDNLMLCIVESLDDDDPEMQISAIKCLHSLSRSVQLLRTTFQDHPVWKPMMKMLQSPNTTKKILMVASSTLCNLLLEFSPSKEPILDYGAITLLGQLTRRPEPELRLNGVWGLMNMAFQAEQGVKMKIMEELGPDQIFRLLSDMDHNTVLKTLGLLRNLLFKHHIDDIMRMHGTHIMQAVVLILESDHSIDVKEQALCILANIADGDTAKDFIMSNEDMLKKITAYLGHSSIKLQIAAVVCVQNLIWAQEDGCGDRQKKLRDLGIYKILQQLLTTTDSALFDKVKSALQQFT